MLERLKARKNFIIADIVSFFVFFILSSVAAQFLEEYHLMVFFVGGILHGKLSAPLEKALVKKLDE
jgi:hypothetical protein